MDEGPDRGGASPGHGAGGRAPAATSAGRLGPWTLNRVHQADCRTALREVPADSVDVAVTSPPYWGQRQGSGIGTEPDPRDYIRNLTAVLAEVMRCLKPSGTLWLNVGDAYNTPINWRAGDHVFSTLGPGGDGLKPTNSAYVKPRGRRRACLDGSVPWLRYGNLLAIPHRVVVAMCDRGFLFRGEVVWHKARPMPEGLCRRPHRHHEGIYVFAKSERHRFRTRPAVPSVWRLTQSPNPTAHHSTFPLDLPLHCIDAAAVAPPAVVLDPFMGSGSTAKAALLRGLGYLGFEIDPQHCALARAHIDEAPVRLDG